MKTKKNLELLKWVFQVSRPALWWTVLFTVLRVIQSLSCILYAYLLGEVINCAQDKNKEAFFTCLGFFLVLVRITGERFGIRARTSFNAS